MTLTKSLLCAACLFLGTARAELPTTQPATRPSQAAVLMPGSVVRLNVPYVEPADPKRTLDLYAPPDAKEAPVVLYVHGGEWAKYDKSIVSYKPRFLNEHGVVFISIDYRLSGVAQHPAQVNDIAAALRWTRDHAREFGGDPKRLFLMGHSAGCHLVTLTALDPRYLRAAGLEPHDLAGVISWSGGAFDLVQKVAEGGMYAPFIKLNFGESESGWRDASPIEHVRDASPKPRFLFISADGDKAPSIAATAKLSSLIAAARGDVSRFVLANKTHFTADHELGQPGDETGKLLLDFVERK